ncbi:MAG: AAA family ATPase [Hyphomicrobiales bacterium]|nr:AAA family ATPase [Hyphomicrobiales bacterium]MCP5371609.1 AAA family ATPase [Hyphomicrobiales bacterium]
MFAAAVKKLAGMTERLPFMAFVSDEITRAVVVKVAEQQGWKDPVIYEGGIIDAIRELADIKTPRTLVIDLTNVDDPMTEIGNLADVCEPNTKVITIGAINDVNLYRELVDLGVQDYLVKPVAVESLAGAVTKALHEPKVEETEPETGELIAFVGARGGVGATTVATNCAWHLAHDYGKRVAIVDLDLYFGSTALALDLEPGRGFREALENPNRIDALFIERAMVRHSDNFYVLGAEEGLTNSFSFDPKALNLLLAHLRDDFDCVVLDLPRFAARTNLVTLKAPYSVVLVSDPSLAGMRDTARLHEFVREVCPEARLKVVLNRVGGLKQGELNQDDFQKGAEIKVAHVLPFDLKPAVDSLGAGKPVGEVSKNSKLAAGLAKLAGDLTRGDVEVKESVPVWRRLMKRSA